MKKLTKTANSIHNWTDLIPSNMKFGKLGSGVFGAAMALSAATEVAADGHEALAERIDPAVLAEIQRNYQACVQDALKGSDWDGNFKIEGDEAAFYHHEALPLCDERAESQVNIALGEQQIAETTERLMDLVQGKTATN